MKAFWIHAEHPCVHQTRHSSYTHYPHYPYTPLLVDYSMQPYFHSQYFELRDERLGLKWKRGTERCFCWSRCEGELMRWFNCGHLGRRWHIDCERDELSLRHFCIHFELLLQNSVMILVSGCLSLKKSHESRLKPVNSLHFIPGYTLWFALKEISTSGYYTIDTSDEPLNSPRWHLPDPAIALT